MFLSVKLSGAYCERCSVNAMRRPLLGYSFCIDEDGAWEAISLLKDLEEIP
jgi:hypothetical protein